MNVNVIIVDNFYSGTSAYDVREFALNQEFNITGNFPGGRTKPLGLYLKSYLQDIVRHAGGNITSFEEYSCNTSYQYTTRHNSSWIHADQITSWAGVCYLTPNAPIDAGTALYRHKETGLYSAPLNDDGSYNEDLMNKIYKDSRDYDKWDLVDKIGNKFNRLVLYRGDLFHCSMEYFGEDMLSGRLFQTFFFDTEY